MTNRDAINLLEEVKILDDTMYAYNPNYLEALDMALTALEAEETWYATHEYPQKQRWIPCIERLPDEIVLVTVETKTFRHRYICEAVWIPRWTWKADYDNWEDCSEYKEDEDEYYVLEGWYERVHNWDEYSYAGIEDDVIAWMPLPEPYKEGGV